MEEDRAIRLYVSGKITENQLDHQRKFITERLEILRNRLDDLRARAANGAEKQAYDGGGPGLGWGGWRWVGRDDT